LEAAATNSGFEHGYIAPQIIGYFMSASMVNFVLIILILL
jgi:hypothetical protein